MSDITVQFKTIVNDIEIKSNIDAGFRTSTISNLEKYQVTDTFKKECLELWKHIAEMRILVKEIKPLYFDESNIEMSLEEKDQFDNDFRFQLQQYLEKLKFLEKYENNRSAQVLSSINSTHNPLLNIISNLTNSTQAKESSVRLPPEAQITIIQHRSGMLQFLNIQLSDLSKRFSNLQEARIVRQRELKSVDFQEARKRILSTNSNTNMDIVKSGESLESDHSIEIHVSPIVETTKDEVQEYETVVKSLNQKQLQILESEHEDLINYKNQQLHDSENINQTVVEIAALQNELAMHLQSQNDTINRILDNHETINLDIQQANKQLKGASKRGGNTANMISLLAIVFGVIILLLDRIN
ncbi:related to Syntaxin UFE1 [Saccharomycodes ludwigii]|uniref:Related to Syntaxin UFE1 n=1 Tax=Saccharomycodes ludwigii TaxID=36035 RepID=A0A376B578_9ASCO|nr:hypothetical protein SCDLUD_003133 [Saccharomycodes ludwigii]KAH3900163.1 hypothetical protein SCDLUD_003133 [Saccharomycodes ludwigii]SSD59845.1 related to Syntaxin UFE1 [Saccharomycodes ludwigii]